MLALLAGVITALVTGGCDGATPLGSGPDRHRAALLRHGGRPDLDAGRGGGVSAAVRDRRRRLTHLLAGAGAAAGACLPRQLAQACGHAHRGRRLPDALRGRGLGRQPCRRGRARLPHHGAAAGACRFRAAVRAEAGRPELHRGGRGEPDAARRHRRQPAAELLPGAGAARADVRSGYPRVERHAGGGGKLSHDLPGAGRGCRRRRGALLHHRGARGGRRLRRRLRRRGRR